MCLEKSKHSLQNLGDTTMFILEFDMIFGNLL